MKAVIQRVTRGKVTIEGKVHGEIGRGFVVLLGVASRASLKATAISMLYNKFVVDVVNGNGAELLQDALSKQQRSFLVLDQYQLRYRSI